MSIFAKIMDTMRLNDNDDDDYFLDDEEYEDEKPVRKSSNKKDDYYEEQEQPSKPRFLSKQKVVPMKHGMEVSLIKPTTIEDAREVCDYLLSGKAVVLNMEGIHTEVAQRIIDFTSGATYSMNGNLQKISNYIFIATPSTVDLSGDFRELINNSTSSLDVSGLNLRV